MFRKLAAALLAPLLVAAACATESDDAAIEVRTGPSGAVAALAAAPDAAAEAGTASFEMVVTMSIEGQTFDMVGSGAFDTDAHQMAMTFDLGAAFEQLAASTGDTVPAELTGPMEMVVDGATTYMRAPMFEAFGGADRWLSLSLEDLGATTEDLGLGFGANDPSRILDSLRGVTGEPEVVGTEDIDGVETTHYAATIDLAKAVAEAPAATRGLLEAQLDQLEGAEIAVDVWVDADGLARRMRMDMGGMMSALAGGVDASAVMTIDFFDFGEPVQIDVPSADEVTSFTDVFGDLSEGIGDPPS